MSTATKVTSSALRKMFQACSFTEADGWTPKKLEANLKNINELITDETEITDDSVKGLLETLMTALTKDEPVVIEWDGADEPEEGTAPAVSLPAVAPAGKKKSKTKAKETEVAATKEEKGTKGKKAAAKGKPEKKGDSPGRGYRIGEHSSTSVIHWMARKGFEFDDAKKVLKHYKITEISDSNLKSRLAVGKSDRGKPATLSKEEAATIKKVAGKA